MAQIVGVSGLRRLEMSDMRDEERREMRKAFEISDSAHIGVIIPNELVDLIRDYIVRLLKDNDSRLTAVNWTLNGTWNNDGEQVICHFPEQRDANYIKRETLKHLSDDKSNIYIRLVNFADETDRDAVSELCGMVARREMEVRDAD